MKKFIFLVLLCVSQLSYSQTLQEQVQAKEQKAKAQSVEYERTSADRKELQDLKYQRIRENSHIIVCPVPLSAEIFAFNKGVMYEATVNGGLYTGSDFEKTLDPKFLQSFSEKGAYSKKGNTVSWKKPYPPGHLLYEVNISTGEQFYQNSLDKKIYGPKNCKVSVSNPQNI